MNAGQTVYAYFDALTAGDAQQLTDLMSQASYFAKIGTDENEFIEGGQNAPGYYRHHVDSTEDFTIEFEHLDIQERDTVAWFYTRQIWNLKWQGVEEELVIRMTGVLEKKRTSGNLSRSTPRLAPLNSEVDMPDPHPNILLITTDQQRGDCLSLDPHGPYAGGLKFYF